MKWANFVWTCAHTIQKLRTNRKRPCYSISFIYCCIYCCSLAVIYANWTHIIWHTSTHHPTVRHEQNEFNFDIFSAATKEFPLCVMCTFNQFDQWTMTPISNSTSNYTTIYYFFQRLHAHTHTNENKLNATWFSSVVVLFLFIFLRRNVQISKKKMPCLYCNVNKFTEIFPSNNEFDTGVNGVQFVCLSAINNSNTLSVGKKK